MSEQVATNQLCTSEAQPSVPTVSSPQAQTDLRQAVGDILPAFEGRNSFGNCLLKTEGYSHIMQDTPAAVWIPGAQTLATGPVLLTRLDGNLGNLQAQEKVRVTGQHDNTRRREMKLWACV